MDPRANWHTREPLTALAGKFCVFMLTVADHSTGRTQFTGDEQLAIGSIADRSYAVPERYLEADSNGSSSRNRK